MRFNFHDGLVIADNLALDFDHFAGIVVNNSGHLGGGGYDVTGLQGAGAGEHAEAVGEVDELEEVTIDGFGEDGFDDTLPSDDNRKVHRCQRCFASLKS